jgi:apolipoprotein N-acyltransferase
VLSALLYASAFPPTAWRALAWVSLVPYLLALRAVGLRAGLWLTLLFTELTALLAARALPRAVSDYFLQPVWISWAFALLVWAGMGSIYYLPFAWAYRSLARRRSPWARPLLAAAAWTAVELARARLLTATHLFIGNPWAILGYSQAGRDVLVQVASVTGVYGVSFVVAAVNAGLVEVGLAARRRLWRAGVGAGAAAAAPLVAAGVYGVVALGSAGRGAAAADAVPIAVVQANVDVGSQWRPELYGRNLDAYLSLTAEAIEAVRPRVVVWPEAALTFHLQDEPVFQRTIASALAAGDVELIAGGPEASDGAPSEQHNSVFLLSETGDIVARYDKQVLLPFAEYRPLAALDLLRRDFGEVESYSPGEGDVLLPSRAGPAGVLVCNEAMLPELAADRVRAGASWLVNPSNDSWIAARGFAQMMFDLVSLRAVEQRRYLVRASTGGPSAVIDPWGRAAIRSEPLSRAIVVGDVWPRSDLSPYARLGDSFAVGCALAVGLALALPPRRRAPQTASQ